MTIDWIIIFNLLNWPFCVWDVVEVFFLVSIYFIRECNLLLVETHIYWEHSMCFVYVIGLEHLRMTLSWLFNSRNWLPYTNKQIAFTVIVLMGFGNWKMLFVKRIWRLKRRMASFTVPILKYHQLILNYPKIISNNPESSSLLDFLFISYLSIESFEN